MRVFSCKTNSWSKSEKNKDISIHNKNSPSARASVGGRAFSNPWFHQSIIVSWLFLQHLSSNPGMVFACVTSKNENA
jgi:hypothetical protein